MENKYDKAKKILKEANQEHLLRFYDNLGSENKEKLLNEILNINFKEIDELFININKVTDLKENIIEPIPYIDKENLEEGKRKYYEKIGFEEIKNDKLAVVTMAGGQGTRLRAQWTKRYIYTKCEG